MVQDGSKKQTVRAFRKTPVKPGELAHLYTGLRTKYVKKLVDPSPEIINVQSILIYPDGDVFLIQTNWLTPSQRVILEEDKKATETFSHILMVLSAKEKDVFAWNDGFRSEDGKNFELFIRCWKQTHQLPFVGFVTYW